MAQESRYKTRADRRAVSIAARLRCSRGWSDVVIRNVSSSGLMGASPNPPARGDYVEVRCGTYVMVARVAWSEGAAFGAQGQGRIYLPDLMAGSEGRAKPPAERRKLPRGPLLMRPPTMAERADRSVRAARLFDFASVALSGTIFAGLATSVAYQALANPLERASQILATEPKSDNVR
jgi:hypothetical protein